MQPTRKKTKQKSHCQHTNAETLQQGCTVAQLSSENVNIRKQMHLINKLS